MKETRKHQKEFEGLTRISKEHWKESEGMLQAQPGAGGGVRRRADAGGGRRAGRAEPGREGRAEGGAGLRARCKGRWGEGAAARWKVEL